MSSSNPFTGIINSIIKQNLSKINSGIKGAIKSGGLDPWSQVASDTDNFGTINLGICHASANASYVIQNMKGLSSINITKIDVQSAQTDPNDSKKLLGTVSISAKLDSNISAHLGGSFEAKCGFIHPRVGISGTVTAKGTTASASGSYTAILNDSNQICLDSITVSALSINYDSVNATVDGLGIFNTFVSPLIDAVVSLFKSQIRSEISNALTPIFNNEVNSALPQCQDIS